MERPIRYFCCRKRDVRESLRSRSRSAVATAIAGSNQLCNHIAVTLKRHGRTYCSSFDRLDRRLRSTTLRLVVVRSRVASLTLFFVRGECSLNGDIPVVELRAHAHTCENFQILGEIDVSTTKRKGARVVQWTAQEDQNLRSAVRTYGEKDNWKAVADKVGTRTHLQCLQRWKKSLKPGLQKGHWDASEDALLLDLVQGNGSAIEKSDWQRISERIPGRNAKQCRERWFLNLDPSINRGPWTPEEDAKLVSLQQSLGGKWSLMAKSLPGRTENAVKTRFHSLQRQAVRARGWQRHEDRLIVETCLTQGKVFDKIAKNLPGRSKGQVKKRYAMLVKRRPQLDLEVERAQERIRGGYPVTGFVSNVDFYVPASDSQAQRGASHKTAAATHKRSSGASAPVVRRTSSNPNPGKTLANRKGSSWLDTFAANQPPRKLSKRTTSTDILENILGESAMSDADEVGRSRESGAPPATMTDVGALDPLVGAASPTATAIRPPFLGKRSDGLGSTRMTKRANSSVILEQAFGSGFLDVDTFDASDEIMNDIDQHVGDLNLFATSSTHFNDSDLFSPNPSASPTAISMDDKLQPRRLASNRSASAEMRRFRSNDSLDPNHSRYAVQR